MSKSPFLAAALFAVAFALPASAQDAMKKDAAVKPADPESKVVLDSWNDIGRKLIAMAEDFPEDKYDFKPTPAQRSFAEQLLHVAGANYYFINPVIGQKPPAAEDPKRDQYKTKADVVAFVKKSMPTALPPSNPKARRASTTPSLTPSPTSRSECLITPTVSSSTAANTTDNWSPTIAYPVWSRQNRDQRNSN